MIGSMEYRVYSQYAVSISQSAVRPGVIGWIGTLVDRQQEVELLTDDDTVRIGDTCLLARVMLCLSGGWMEQEQASERDRREARRRTHAHGSGFHCSQS